MQKFQHTKSTVLISPVIELIAGDGDYNYDHNYWSEVLERMDYNFYDDVTITWDSYNDKLLTLRVTVVDDTVNYEEKLDKAIDTMNAYCYDYECKMRINGEVL